MVDAVDGGQSVIFAVGLGNELDGLEDRERDPIRGPLVLLKSKPEVLLGWGEIVAFDEIGGGVIEGCAVPGPEVMFPTRVERLPEGWIGCSDEVGMLVPDAPVEFAATAEDGASPAVVELNPVGVVPRKVAFGTVVRLG